MLASSASVSLSPPLSDVFLTQAKELPGQPQLVVKACISHGYDLNPALPHSSMVPPADGYDTAGQCTPASHGSSGMLPVDLPGRSQLFDSRVTATTKELLEEFLFKGDMGGGDVLSVSSIQASI